MRVSGQRHTPAELYSRENDPPVSIVQEAGWVPELVWKQFREKIFLPLPGIELRSLGCSVRSQTLYLLSYPDSQISDNLSYEDHGLSLFVICSLFTYVF
jgi:hypothetical protein